MKKLNSIQKMLMLGIIALTTSCSPYVKLVEVTSENAKTDAEQNIIFENDTVRVEYDLWGAGGYMNFRVYNKLEQPIYINWFKSSYVKEDVKYSYAGEWRDLSFVPPKSYVTNPVSYVLLKDQGAAVYLKSKKPGKKIKIENVDLRNDKEAILEKVNKTYAKSGQVKTYSKNYDKTNTPLFFRNFITVSTCESADECHNAENLIYFNNKFYVSKMTEMPIKQLYGKGTKTVEYVKRGNKRVKVKSMIYEMPYSAGNRFYIPLYF